MIKRMIEATEWGIRERMSINKNLNKYNCGNLKYSIPNNLKEIISNAMENTTSSPQNVRCLGISSNEWGTFVSFKMCDDVTPENSGQKTPSCSSKQTPLDVIREYRKTGIGPLEIHMARECIQHKLDKIITKLLHPIMNARGITTMMCKPQLVQLDCRNEACRFHHDGECTHDAPELTIINGASTCHSKK